LSADPLLETHLASDGYRFYLRRYPAGDHPRGRIVFLHGIRSHGGWYSRSCAALAAAGYEVIFPDRRGAGLNTAHRGDTPGFRRLLDDVAELLRQERLTRPWMPTFLAGISWGGRLACGVPYRAPGLIDGLILLCPGLCPLVVPTFGRRLAVTRARVRFPDRMYPIPLNEPELFTASPEWRHFIETDRHGLTEATARFLVGSTQLGIYLQRAVKRVTMPTLLMLAKKDQIVDNAKTKAFFATFGSADKTVLEYPDAHHTLEFEPEGHRWFEDFVGWLSSTTRPAGKHF
jgi:alpha-beta hydrolase superfamily lysophospholipase